MSQIYFSLFKHHCFSKRDTYYFLWPSQYFQRTSQILVSYYLLFPIVRKRAAKVQHFFNPPNDFQNNFKFILKAFFCGGIASKERATKILLISIPPNLF